MPTPDVRIIDSAISIAGAAGGKQVDFTVHNEGKTSARDCILRAWQRGFESSPSYSRRFGVAPNETLALTVHLTFRKTARVLTETVEMRARVNCSNGSSDDHIRSTVLF